MTFPELKLFMVLEFLSPPSIKYSIFTTPLKIIFNFRKVFKYIEAKIYEDTFLNPSMYYGSMFWSKRKVFDVKEAELLERNSDYLLRSAL